MGISTSSNSGEGHLRCVIEYPNGVVLRLLDVMDAVALRQLIAVGEE